MLVQNNVGHITIGSHNIELQPGLNRVSDKDWAEAKQHEGCARLLASKKLEEIAEPKAPAKKPELSLSPPKE